MKNFLSDINKYLSNILMILTISILFSSCVNDKNITFDASKITSLSWNSDCVRCEKNAWGQEDNDFNIQLDKIVNLKDTIEASKLIGASYLSTDCMIGIQSNDASIESAKRIIKLYPTIWAIDDMSCIQFVYLYDHGYDYTEDLEIKEGRILFKPYIRNVNMGNEYFKNITPKEIHASICNIPISYSKKEGLLSYELKDWNNELPQWLKLASRYKKGDFASNNRVIFDVSPYEIYLCVTFKTEEGDRVTKIFTDFAVIGN